MGREAARQQGLAKFILFSAICLESALKIGRKNYVSELTSATGFIQALVDV